MKYFYSPKFCVSFVCLLFWSALVCAQSEGVQILSDVDDTVKQTHVENKVAAGANGLFSMKTFPGMAQLYNLMIAKNVPAEIPAVKFISGSPESLSGMIRRTLEKSGFKNFDLELKNWFKDKSTYDFKTRSLNRAMEKTNLPFVLFGDDTEKDPEIFHDFSQKNPNRVKQIYIHSLKGKELPEGEIPFLTAFEIAVNEFEVGALTENEVEKIWRAVSIEHSLDEAIPEWSQCPKEHKVKVGVRCKQNKFIMNLVQMYESSVMFLCQARETKKLEATQSDCKSPNSESYKLHDELREIIIRSERNK